jgi:UDP:flavonoid glycosyltransferase YjiC (YdhE family)
MVEKQKDIKKVFILTIPFSGHVDPVIQIGKELTNERKVKTVIYSTENYKNKIEKSGAEFRNYDGVIWQEMIFKLPFNKRVSLTSQLIEKEQHIIENNLKKLAIDIKNEKPNLILYEFQSIYAKYVVRFLNDNYYDSNSSMPSILLFSTSFIFDKTFYPNEYENNSGTMARQDVLKETKIRLKSYQMSKKLNISYKDPFKEIFEIDSRLENIVFTFPELQPRSHLFNKNNKFVGSCICTDEEIYYEEDDYIQKLIDPYFKTFPENTSKNDLNNSNKNKLVLVSLGEMFGDNIQLYLTVINAFKINIDDNQLLNEQSTNLETISLFIIVSVGEKCFSIFNDMLTNNELKLANNMLVVPFISQIQVLKRASLFITQSDIISIHKSIAYGVPMICIPLTSDQLKIAYRVTTDLGLGITLDFLNLKSNEIRYEIMNILQDSSYNERCIRYSKISAEYDSQKNAADIIEGYLI